MFNKIVNKQKQKGLSLIEASMVLVLSAVVVAGVMVYYQTAQSNNQLEKTSEQIMHIVSEINGLYAGAKDPGNGIYFTLSTQTVLNAVNDQEAVKASGASRAIKTAIPDVYIHVQGMDYDAVNKTLVDGGQQYAITLSAEKAGDLKMICQRFVGLNFGGQSTAFMVGDDKSNIKAIDTSQPFNDRLTACQKLSGTDANVIGVLLK